MLLLPVGAYLVWVRLPWLRMGRRASGPAYRREQLIVGLRLAIAAALIMGLAGIRLYSQTGRQAVIFLIDGSASVSPVRQAAEAFVVRALAHKSPGDLAGVAVFGRDGRLEVPPARMPVFRGLTADPAGTLPIWRPVSAWPDYPCHRVTAVASWY